MMTLISTILATAWLSIAGGSHYIQTESGNTFYWMGCSLWLAPENLEREDADLVLDRCKEYGYNVVHMLATDEIPSVNAYGQRSGSEDYWKNVDHLIDKACENGIYVALSCMSPSGVESGEFDSELAAAYGTFLAGRYKDKPNIIWVMGGDCRTEEISDVWNALANAIKKVDTRHLMTFHPAAGSSAVESWKDAAWLDFVMFQSDDETTADDGWNFTREAWKSKPVHPVVASGPSLSPELTRCDAYWSVFEGAAGYSICNSIGTAPFNLSEEGLKQMKHLRRLMDTFSSYERVCGQDAIIGNIGTGEERIAATRGKDFLLAYTYVGSSIRVDLTAVSGTRKQAWWFYPSDGGLEYIGEFKENVKTFTPTGSTGSGNDRVLIVVDSRSAKKVKEMP